MASSFLDLNLKEDEKRKDLPEFLQKSNTPNVPLNHVNTAQN
jgi:hypothetical protein